MVSMVVSLKPDFKGKNVPGEARQEGAARAQLRREGSLAQSTSDEDGENWCSV